MPVAVKPPVAPKGTRVTLVVDVSHTMKSENVQGLKGAWSCINDCLGEDDLVSLSTYAVTFASVFSYMPANSASWDGKDNAFQKLSKEAEDGARGYELALYDAIVKVVKECPRNLKYKKFRPEIFIFAIGAENSSKATLQDVEQVLTNPKIPGLHVTIIDASDNANAELEEIVKPLEHCDFYGGRMDKAAIRKCFEQAQRPFRERVRAAARIGGDSTAGGSADPAAGDEIPEIPEKGAGKGGNKKNKTQKKKLKELGEGIMSV